MAGSTRQTHGRVSAQGVEARLLGACVAGLMFAPPAWAQGLGDGAAAADVAPITAASSAVADPKPLRFRFETTPGHLSKAVRPQRSRLSLELDPARSEFSGLIRIELHLLQAQETIELHAHELTALDARFIDASGTQRPLRVQAQAATQTWRLEPLDTAPLPAGAGALEIRYRGRVQQVGEGLYVVPYRVSSGNGRGAQIERRMLATQLQAIHARRVFPTFDEPAFKQIFELKVRAPRGLEVLSNMPLQQLVADGSDYAWHQFAPTPPMSSYLLSVAVGRFDVLTGAAGEPVPLRILTAEGRREQAREALRATRQVLPFYADYFGQPYALPKLDQLAVPGVRNGGMEDWGLISYAEDSLLFDPARSDSQTRREIYQMVAHEVAHQWFGNLVTAASWDEIWLNEAFATWLQDKATDRFNPGWQIAVRSRAAREQALVLDAGPASRAIRAGPVRESAVDDVFDEITYAKGGALLSMIEQWLGATTLRQGLASYMQAQRLSNATAADLWHHLGRAAAATPGVSSAPGVADSGAGSVDVATMATSWTDQPGFPLVAVDSRCQGGRTRLRLVQTPYTRGAPSSDAPEPTAAVAVRPPPRWLTPVPIRQGQTQFSLLLAGDTPLEVDLGACADLLRGAPVLVNAGGLGFYRVAYDATLLQALVAQAGHLAGADRVTLLSDSHALLLDGHRDAATHFALAEAMLGVDDAARPLLWAQWQRQLTELDRALDGLPAQQTLRAFGRRLAEPLLARLGWTPPSGEDEDSAELRSTLVLLLARFEHAGTVQQALRAFDADASGRRRLPPGLRDAVIQVTGMWSDAAHAQQLRRRLASSNSEDERWLYASALAAGRDPARAQDLLTASLGDALAPPHVAVEIAGLMARLSPHGALAYAHTVSHWSTLAAHADASTRMGLLPHAAAGALDPALADRLLADQRRLAGPDGDSAAQRQAAAIRQRARVRARLAAALDALAARPAGPPAAAPSAPAPSAR
ncbi:MAG: hypothetical protein RIQ60_3136 [Pseudomonadota bacterium]|jgi:aminopeptidase N